MVNLLILKHIIDDPTIMVKAVEGLPKDLLNNFKSSPIKYADPIMQELQCAVLNLVPNVEKKLNE